MSSLTDDVLVQTPSHFTTPSVGNLQATIRSLVNERRQLRDRLNRGGRNFAMMNDGKPRRYKRDRTEFETENHIEEVPDKRFQPGGSLVSIRPPLASTATDFPAMAFPVEKRPSVQLDDSTVKRNRNLFGSLVGHLKKAKTVLDQEKNTKAAELHRTMEEQVTQKLDFERKNLAELRRRDFQERQRKDLARIREVQSELRMKENEMLSLCLQQHFNRMKSFIRTDTAPLIFWIPSLHNDKTKQLQDDTRQQIDKKLKSIVEKFAAENEKVRVSLQATLNSLVDLRQGNMLLDKSDAAAGPTDSTAETGSLEVIRGVHPDLINDSDDSDDEPVCEQAAGAMEEQLGQTVTRSVTMNDDGTDDDGQQQEQQQREQAASIPSTRKKGSSGGDTTKNTKTERPSRSEQILTTEEDDCIALDGH